MINDESLTAIDVAALLHIGKNAVYDLAKSGELPSYRMGRKILFSLADVEAYAASKRVGGEKTLGAADPVGAAGSAATLGASSASAGEAARSAMNATRDNKWIVGGIGMPASLIADRLRESGADAVHVSMTSYSSLCSMYEGKCSAALVHLYDQRTNGYNIPYVQRLIPGSPVIVFRLAKRWQGFVVAKGNPKGISSWGALLRPDTRVANRRRGCGSRILLDEKLLAMEADPASISGYASVYDTGLLAAEAVARGIADVAVAGEQIPAQIDDVDFVPMQQEWIDLVVSKEGEGRSLVRRVKSMIEDNAFRAEYGRIVHGDVESFGSIVYEC